jgi:hypothetical protein
MRRADVKLPSGAVVSEQWLLRVTEGFAQERDFAELNKLPMADLKYIIDEWLKDDPMI